ncbi:type I-E CRISPR-associated protein Cas7/Cse4/CasC [Magnetofaba australis]|uniref:Putative CRISPR-associated protein, Cse4 family n=1 Tax=Magnetofaba australis IT-1 TaxID=1434232 RepID=A0A1Y2JZJ9_9PROT|nr:type I-E CRISPR-associated protein Cas7/Cse4/CasC [Magnetofaba australis]OSM00328.1 putative CRISPR-associated protein, Cse4 family [Magnetofaba australis IT-1]
MDARFLQIHFLTPYPAALLNRDDVGAAKRMPFGGTSRIRVSSQCLKRHWRMADDDRALSTLVGGESGMSLRSRRSFEEYLVKPLVAAGHPEKAVNHVVLELANALVGANKKKAKKGEEADGEPIETGQVVVIGHQELTYLKGVAEQFLAAGEEMNDAKKANKAVTDYLKAHKDLKENLKALGQSGTPACGLDGALFGRMITSDAFARVDASIHVAHAFTVQAEETESDYFTAVDDLVADSGELGSGMIGNADLTSGLYYGYVVVDLPLLVSNLTGCAPTEWQAASRELAGSVVENLIHLIASVTPGAKKGSTAPYARAEMLLVEAGSQQPRTLANAFYKPLEKHGDAADAIARLGGYLNKLDAMYEKETRRAAALHDLPDELGENAGSLAKLAAWAGDVAAGRA